MYNDKQCYNDESAIEVFTLVHLIIVASILAFAHMAQAAEPAAKGKTVPIVKPRVKTEPTKISRNKLIYYQLKSTKIPKLDFDQTNAEDAIRLLADCCNPAPKNGGEPNPAYRINTIFKIRPLKPAIAPVTLRANGLSAFEALNLICSLSDLKWSVKYSSLIIERK